jgi:hypothetical protein
MAQLGAEPETRHWGPSQVHALLVQEFPGEPDRDAISLRTVQNLWPSLRDDSEDWVLRPGDPDPAFTLQCLATRTEYTKQLLRANRPVESRPGPATIKPHISLDEVKWIRVVHAARPDLDPVDVSVVAAMFFVADLLGDRDMAADLTYALARCESGTDFLNNVLEVRRATEEEAAALAADIDTVADVADRHGTGSVEFQAAHRAAHDKHVAPGTEGLEARIAEKVEADTRTDG